MHAARQCQTCHYTYKVLYKDISNFFIHPVVVASLTLVVVTTAIVVVAWLVRRVFLALFGVVLSRATFALNARLIAYSIITIGLVTLVVLLVSTITNHDQNQGAGDFLSGVLQNVRWQPNLAPVHSPPAALPAGIGWGLEALGFGGFVLFVAEVYIHVQALLLANFLQPISQRILEVD